ncbi:MAG: cell division protein FtsQ/DivIB [Anaerolineae bacterium]
MSRFRTRSTTQGRRSLTRSGVDMRSPEVGWPRVRSWLAAHLAAGIGLTILVLCLVFGGTLLFGSQFRVGQVLVYGADLLDIQAILQAADVSGRSIITISPRQVEARLRKQFVCIASLSIQRQLPNLVTIRLEEEPARWAWESGGRFWWVKEDGSVIGEMPDASRLFVIHDINRVYSAPGEYIPGFPWRLASDMLQALPVIPAFDYTPGEGLIVYVTDQQWPVYLGNDGDARVKAALLRALVGTLVQSQTAVGYIDLRNESRPLYKKLT